MHGLKKIYISVFFLGTLIVSRAVPVEVYGHVLNNHIGHVFNFYSDSFNQARKDFFKDIGNAFSGGQKQVAQVLAVVDSSERSLWSKLIDVVSDPLVPLFTPQVIIPVVDKKNITEPKKEIDKVVLDPKPKEKVIVKPVQKISSEHVVNNYYYSISQKQLEQNRQELVKVQNELREYVNMSIARQIDSLSNSLNRANIVTVTTQTVSSGSGSGANFSETVLGLDYAGGVLSVTSGYEIPTTSSTTAWTDFYNTPSSRITAGTGLSWSGNTLNAVGGGSGTVNSGTAGQVAFYDANGTAVSGTSTLFLANGNVGIGTSSPTASLTVNKTGGNLLDLYGSGTHVRHYNNAGVQKMYQFLNDGQNTYEFTSSTDFQNIMSLNYSTKYVGIGTNAPGANLDVKNYARFLGSANSATGVPTSGEGVEITYDSSGNIGYIFAYDRDAATNRDLLLGVNGSSQLYLKADGNVGIGSTTPAARLTVKGSGTGTGKAFVVTNSSNTEKVIVLDNGNVGIGASPTQTLDVNGNIYGRSILYSRDIRGSSTDGSLSLRGSDRHDSTQILIQGLSNGSDMQFLTDTTGAVNTATVQMVLKSSGNLGIGSTTPSGKLVVQNTGSGNSFVVEDQSGDTTPFVINASGNVGIGTTTSFAKLSVSGDIALTGGIFDTNNSLGTDGYVLQSTGTGVEWVATSTLGFTSGGSGTVNSGTLGQVAFYDANGTAVSGTSTLFLANGNVGIGTTTPSAKLSIAGVSGSTNQLFAVASSSGSQYFSVTSDGNVGVGSSTPLTSFFVHTDAGSLMQIQRNAAASSFSQIDIVQPTGYQSIGDGFSLIALGSSYTSSGAFVQDSAFFGANAGLSGGFSIAATNASAPIRLYTGGSTDANERLRITSTGDVGIGTTSPIAKLSVTGSGTGTGRAFVIADSNNVPRFTVLDNGNLGFGSTTPGSTLSGPLTGAFSIAASSPVQGASTASGNSLTLRAANATRGTVSGAGNGGSLSITAGHATSTVSGSGSGGSITLTAGNQASSDANAFGQGGNISLLAGAGASSNFGTGGSVIITAGAGTAGFGGQGGSITLTSGDSTDGGAGNIQTGAVTIKSADTAGASTGDVLLAVGDTTANTEGPGTLTIRGGRSNYTAGNPIASGLVQIVTQQGGSNNSSSGSGTAGGAQLFTLGAGGSASGNTSATGGTGGAWTVAGAAGGNATGSGGTQLGGNGSTLSLTSGAGGNATGASGTRTGGNGGNISIITGAGGTGATANGTAGVLSLGVGGSTHLRIDASGNIGIGTTSPAYLLHMRKDQNAGTIATVQNGTSGTGAFSQFMLNSSSDSFQIGLSSAAYSVTGGSEMFGQNTAWLIGSAAGGVNLVASNAAGVLRFATGGVGTSSERMRITSSGLVGIGTTAPGNLLTIAQVVSADTLPALGANGGKFAILNTDTVGGPLKYGLLSGVLSTGNAYMQVQRVDGTATAYNMLLQPNGGNVGIGTTTPTSKLSFAQGGINPWNNANGGLTINNNLGGSIAGFTNSVSGDYAGMGFYRPGGAADAGDLQLYSLGSSYISSGIFTPSTTMIISRGDFTGGLKIGAQSGPVSLFAGGILATNIGLTLSTAGNVGVGTTTPVSKLQIYDSGDSATITNFTQSLTSAGMHISSDFVDGNYTPGVFWSTINNNPSKPKAGIFTRNTNTGSFLYIGTSNGYTTGLTNTALTIDPSGNIGIGTTTPGQKLTVIGNAQFTAVTSGTYASDLNITSDGTLTTSASDIRLKENLAELSTPTLDKIKQLKAYTFNWKNDSEHRLDVGLIAQDVEFVFPELVFTNKTDGFKGVNYSRLSVLLLKGIQEQQMLIGSYTSDISVQAVQAIIDQAKSEAERNPIVIIGDRATQGLRTVTDFVSVRVTAVKGYFSEIFTKEITAEKICLTKSNGSKVCVDGDQLENIINKPVVQSQPAANIVPVAPETETTVVDAPVITETSESTVDTPGTEASTPVIETPVADTSIPVSTPAADTSTGGGETSVAPSSTE